jgi:pyruvate,water dikinase
VKQARPETVQSRRRPQQLEIFHLTEKRPVLVHGRAVGQSIASGPVRIVKSPHELHEVQPGDVLVNDKTDPDWEPTMKKAAAIVTNRRGRTCHAAIVSREMGLPAMVGTETATGLLRTGQDVTVSCAEGETGCVYDGRAAFEIQRVDLGNLTRPKTKIMLNVGNPEEALRLSQLPSEGVGLARLSLLSRRTSRCIHLHCCIPNRSRPRNGPRLTA